MKDLRDTTAEWLNGFPWDYFITQTFAKSTWSCFTAKRRFCAFIEKINKSYQLRGIDYFLAVEPHKSGTYHVHGLINGCAGVSEDELWEVVFQGGRFSASKYDRNLGASHYLTKYVLKDLCYWDIKIRKSSQGKLFSGKG